MKVSDYDKAESQGSPAQLFPLVAGAVVPMFNVPNAGENRLVLSRALLVRMFAGNISTWDDPDLLEYNPWLKSTVLQKSPVTRIVRRDSSGTTELFTTALSNMDKTQGLGLITAKFKEPTAWPTGAAPAPTLTSSADMVKRVMQTPYSIGQVYVPARGDVWV